MAQYQDIIKHGKVTKKGQRECDSRYLVIKEHLRKFQRPFTMLDIGANLGYFSFRIACDFPESICVMIEDHYSEKLKTLCEENNLTNIIFLKQKVNSKLLEKIADCEHFDVVLALNVVHHIGDVENTLSAIEKIGETVIIETPHYSDEGSCGKEHLETIYNHIDKNYIKIGSFSRHTSSQYCSIMGIITHKKSNLKLKFWDSSKLINDNLIFIDATDTLKLFSHKEKNEIREWIPGINLRTYQYLNGMYPSRVKIAELLDQFKNIEHTDLTPWNIIISGKKLNYIDNIDPTHTKITNPVFQIEKIKKEILDNFIFDVKKYKQ
jgi:SAM-dependent methyltransferase